MHFSYFYLTLHMLLFIDKPSDIMAVNISINQNVSGLVGRNDTHLTCSFTKDVDQNILNVAIVSRNKDWIFDINDRIVIFLQDKAAIFFPSGEYLSGRVTLTNMTYVSTDVTMTFKKLNCEDEKDYICTITYSDKFGVVYPEKSEQSRILVKASPSKPDVISSLKVGSTQSEEHVNSSSTFLREGDTVLFICTGNIGKPPGKFFWQMYSPQHGQLIIYSNATTEKEEIPENCTFRGRSNLTVHISPAHFNTKYRCFEESQANVAGMFVDTEPLNVHFQVNHVNISKQPNQKQYDQKTDNITLTCKGNGNPEPQYEWFKKENNNNILSKKSFYVIENVIQNNSGVYICEVYNILDDVFYRMSNSVEIDIVHIDELPSSQDLSLLTICIVYVIPVVCVVLVIVICFAVIKHWCIRPKRKKNEENYYQTLSHDVMTVNPEYASVIHTNNTSVGEAGDNVVCTCCNNGKDGDKNKSRNNVSDRTVIYDEVNQQANLIYESSKKDTPERYNNLGFDVSTESSMNDGETMQPGYLTCKEMTDVTSVQDPNNYENLIAPDRTAVNVYVYDDINQQTTLKFKESNARVLVSTVNIDQDALQ